MKLIGPFKFVRAKFYCIALERIHNVKCSVLGEKLTYALGGLDFASVAGLDDLAAKVDFLRIGDPTIDL